MRKWVIVEFAIFFVISLLVFLHLGVGRIKNNPLVKKNKIENNSEEKREVDAIKKEEEKKDVELLFGGELILARMVGLRMDQRGVDYPFDGIRNIFRKADFSFATLESSFMGEGKVCDPMLDCMVFVAKEKYLDGVEATGIDVVSLASNHIGDGGDEALLRTMNILDERIIGYFGAGKDRDEAYKGKVFDVSGTEVGFLGCCDIPPVSYNATESNPGSAGCDEIMLLKSLKELREEADIVVFAPHWGVEYTSKPTVRETELAHLMIDGGVDIIIGDHPHWIGNFEVYKGKPIFYSVGNLVFDQEWSEKTTWGILVRTRYNERILKGVEVVPFKLHDYCCPELAEGDKKKEIMEYFYNNSDKESVKWLEKMGGKSEI